MRIRAITAALLISGLVPAVASANDAQTWAREIPGPTVSVSVERVANVPKTLTKPTAKVFHFFGGHPGRAGKGFPDNLFLLPDNVSGAAEAPPWFVTFKALGRQVRVFTKGSGVGTFRLYVNGKLAMKRPHAGPPGDGAGYMVTFRFPSSKARTLMLEMSGRFFFGGASGGLSAAKTKLGRRVIFYGDSWTEPTGSVAPFTGLATRAGWRMGWADTWASGSGGTGYVNSGVTGAGRFTLGQRLQHDVIAQKPAVVVLAGGINDIEAGTPAQIQAAAHDVIARIQSSLPKTKIVVVGPWWTNDTPTPGALAADDAVHRAAGTLPFIDPMGEHWITNGNLIGADGAHPNQRGHDYLGDKLALALKAALH